MNWLRKIIQRFCCAHEYVFVQNIYGDEINRRGGYRSLWQCIKCGKKIYKENLYDISNNDNLKETLNKFYNEYYENKQKTWVKEHEEFLFNITDKLIDNASKGLCYFEFIMSCKTSTDDKYHFEQWLTENRLEYSCKLYNQKEKYDEINQYRFEISWK